MHRLYYQTERERYSMVKLPKTKEEWYVIILGALACYGWWKLWE